MQGDVRRHPHAVREVGRLRGGSSPIERIRKDSDGHSRHGRPAHVIDPVCGMQILTTDAVGQQEYRGRRTTSAARLVRSSSRPKPEAYVGGAPPRATAPSTVAEPTHASTPARWTPRCARSGPAPARSAAWRWSRRPPRRDTDRVDLPDASRDRPGCARRLPDLRDGARAADGHARGAEPRTRGHDAAVLGGRSC